MTKLIVAIDTADIDVANQWHQRLSTLCMFKYGLEYLYANMLTSNTHLQTGSMIDAKLHDIPNTVTGAMRQLMRIRPSIVTLHASGDSDMIRAARTVADQFDEYGMKEPPHIAAITVLTSMKTDSHAQMSAVGVYTTPRLQTLRLCNMARNSGATAVVCDAEVVSEIRDRFPDLITIVPGVRMSHHLAYDQERTGTPQRLAKDGAHYAVVGRPITMAPDVVQAARDYVDALRLLN